MQYKDLTDEAKEHAFERHQEYAQSNDYYWWESTQDYWVEKLEGLGIYTSTEQMFFSGFGSQGDGACFTGRINLKEFLEAHPYILRRHVDLYTSTIPFDHQGAACEFYDIELTRHGSTNYNHEKSVHLGSWDLDILPELDNDEGVDYERLFVDAEADIESQCREYMRQLYRELEEVHDYEQSIDAFLEVAQWQDFNSDGSLN